MNKDDTAYPLGLTLIIDPKAAPTASLSVIHLWGNINNSGT